MATSRSKVMKSESGWRRSAPGLMLVASVLGILLLTAVLQTEKDTLLLEQPVPADIKRADDDPQWEASSPKPPDEVEDPIAALKRRTEEDYRRLSRDRSLWTAQLLVLCDPENVVRFIEGAGGSPDLYVLPKDHHGRACYRICWGTYSSRDEASWAVDLPESIAAGLPGRPEPRDVAGVTP